MRNFTLVRFRRAEIQYLLGFFMGQSLTFYGYGGGLGLASMRIDSSSARTWREIFDDAMIVLGSSARH